VRHKAWHVLLQDDRHLPEEVLERLHPLDGLVARKQAARTSTASLISGGVKKCVPQTLSGLDVAEARSVMEMEEVLVSSRALGGRISSKAAKASFFGPTF